ncbi:Vitamin B12 transporter BtuB [Sinobacterium norvegicum]|uniref:Vitamin B12 transporter BtuB n=1 Tax=Sinobacterium norvegicum TaxID=1641715 RepID=A0ABM9AGQ2_9GAMM|nr:TonB-dependent receptor [Sinobacterium norvegicum]CAH0992393.1 Vitamin B12 transporter BtuB [Sinobacterium norvegicum]
MFKKLALPAAILAAAPVFATENTNDKIEETVIVASRVETPVSQVLAPVTVISKADIERIQPPSLGALLDSTAGVNMVQSGGTGAQTSLLIRGSATAQSVVLLDGLRVGSATTGSTAYQYLDANSIERVEIVRGSRSSLYGADAVGGVIQLFTNEGLRNQDYNQAYIKQGYGSHNTLNTAAGIQGQSNNTFYQASASHYETEGFDSTAEKDNGNDDNEAFRNTTLSAAVGHHFSEDFSLKATAYQSFGKSEFDNNKPSNPDWSPADPSIAVNPYTDYQVTATSLKADWTVNSVWRTEAVIGASKDETTSKDAYADDNNNLLSFYPSEFNTQRYFANWLNEFTITDNQRLIAGIDGQKDSVDSTADFSEDERDNVAVYGQYEIDFERTHLALSGRSDDNSAYGTNNTGQVDFGVDLSDNINVVASYGTAFRAPSFNDLYYPDDGSAVGNPDIKPESSKNKELSIRGHFDLVDVQVNLFHNEVDDLIEWVYNPNTYYSQPENVSEATLKGVEVVVSTEIAQWTLDANYTHLSATNETTGYDLVQRPEHSADFDLHRDFGQWSVSLMQQIRSSSYSKNDQYATNELAGYGLTHLRLGYAVNSEWQVTAALNNLFDKEYFTNADYNNINYNNDGFNTMLSVAYTPSW